MFVKICGITTEEDGLLAVGLGADAVGFVFAPSKRRVTVRTAREIAARLPDDVMTIGVFKDESPNRVVESVQRAGLVGAQLHGHESPEQVASIRTRLRFVVKAFEAGSPELQHVDRYQVDAIMLDGANPGSGEVFDWTLAESIPDNQRLILAGGLTPGNVAAAVRQVRPWGVDVSSGVERHAGRKDGPLIRRFVASARAAEPEPQHAEGDLPYDWRDDG